MPYMYILECADGSYYTGSTWNLEQRLWEHRNGEGANHTAKHRPVKLIYCEECDRIDDAFRREKQIQGWSRKKKQALIAGDSNKLHLLAECQNESHCAGFGFAQPTGSTRPSDSVKPTDFAQPAGSTKPSDSVKPTDFAQPAGSTRPSDSVKPTGFAQPAGSTKPSDSVKPTDFAQPVDATKPTNPTQTMNSTLPTNPHHHPLPERSRRALNNQRWAQAVCDGFAAAGLSDLVLSPGSRSTPLALAFLRQPAIRCHVLLDERSAAFFALGLAKANQRPAALLCTSGSAPANWFPAVIEADQGATPLILLSADRPPEAQGWGANQTVDQQHLFGRHVRAFHAPGTPHENFSAPWLHRLAARAIAESCWPLPGPVHLNLPFCEPLLPADEPASWPAASLPPAITVAQAVMLPAAQLVARIASQISARPGAIICGGADYPAGFSDAVTALASQLDCPVLVEPLSNLRFGAHERSHLCVRYDAFLRNPGFIAAQRPQWLLRFGAFPVTRTLQNWLADAAAAQHIVVTPDTRWPDPLHATTTLLQADPGAVCDALRAAAPQAAAACWRAAFVRAESAARLAAKDCLDNENFEGALIPALLEQLPPGHRLFCGNSMAIRDLDTFSGSSAKPLTLFGNRGASGIDGNVSTAAGIAVSGATVALLGDLSCAHDIGGLASLRGLDFVLVVINNGGGGIFEYLPQAALPEFERAWLTPSPIDFAYAAQAWGIPHQRLATLAAFSAALEAALAAGGPHLIEVVIDRAQSVAQHRAYWKTVSAE